MISRSDILTDSQNEAALEQIQMLEDSSRYQRHVTDDVTIVQPPQFTRPLHNLETVEGTNVHLECRLQPVGDPTMRVDWFVNGRPVPTGNCSNLFGYQNLTQHGHFPSHRHVSASTWSSGLEIGPVNDLFWPYDYIHLIVSLMVIQVFHVTLG